MRSGVLTSVHAFAVDPGRGLYILCFIVAVVGTSLWLYAWRAPELGKGGGQFALLSRETLLLINNVLFTAGALAVLIGTLYPLALDVLRDEKISVGPPYFEAVFLPLVLPAVALMGVGTVARWKQGSAHELWRRLRGAVALTVLATLLIWLMQGSWGWRLSIASLLGMALGAWCVLSTLVHAWQRLVPAVRQGEGLRRLLRQPWGWWGTLVAHMGVGVFVIAVSAANGLEVKRETSISQGQSMEAGGYRFHFESLSPVTGPNYDAQRAHFRVSHGDAQWDMYPEKRAYRVQSMGLSQAAIDSTWGRDVFIALGEPLDEAGLSWTLRIQIKPLMEWIWLGTFMMALGAALSLLDKRFRTSRSRVRIKTESKVA